MSKIKQIEAIIIDCDGTLTSGGVTYSETGERQKTFHSRDIPAIKKLVGFGFRVMIVSQSTWQGVKYFADRCGCEYYIGVADKLEFVQKMGIDPGSCIVFTDSTDDWDIASNAHSAYSPADSNFSDTSNIWGLDVSGGRGVVDNFLSECIVRHESMKGGGNMMVLSFYGDEITPAPVAKNSEPDPHDFCANAKPCALHPHDQLRKENAELKDWNDKLNECCNSLESEVQMLKAKIYDLINK